MALFYDSCSYEVGKWIFSVDKPALLIVDGINGGDDITLTVVNLSGDSTPVEIELMKKRTRKVLNVVTHEMKPSTIVHCSL